MNIAPSTHRHAQPAPAAPYVDPAVLAKLRAQQERMRAQEQARHESLVEAPRAFGKLLRHAYAQSELVRGLQATLAMLHRRDDVPYGVELIPDVLILTERGL